MRRMRYKGQEFTVYAHAMTRNMWEYYLLDDAEGDIRQALVLGFEQEIGDISLSEIRPHLIGFTEVRPGDELFPPPQGEWID